MSAAENPMAKLAGHSGQSKDIGLSCDAPMPLLLDLQWAQLNHDELYHRDITLLPVGERMTHFALHMAKYVGRIAEAIDADAECLLERAVVDAFIIGLAAANTLRVDLGKNLLGDCPITEDLRSLGFKISDDLGRREIDSLWLLKQFARYSGRLAKSCESLDHVESHPFRESMIENLLELLKIVIVEASLREIDLAKRVRQRLEGVESKDMFHNRYAERLAKK